MPGLEQWCPLPFAGVSEALHVVATASSSVPPFGRLLRLHTRLFRERAALREALDQEARAVGPERAAAVEALVDRLLRYAELLVAVHDAETEEAEAALAAAALPDTDEEGGR